uniref:Matrilin-4-like n=1 Tax=Petromyzon marinus TaxID=7757 RepID=A0AAJ7T5S1_PETMA|nr:matrilin-4-like [Petromyzon marinus]
MRALATCLTACLALLLILLRGVARGQGSLTVDDAAGGPPLLPEGTGSGPVCASKSVDLIFIIDSSRSVRPREFEKMKLFITAIIGNLDIGPDATRVGLIKYGSTVHHEFSLATHRHKAEMVTAVEAMEPLATGTMTGLAIEYAMTVAFTEAEGARPARSRVPRIAIVVTDGRPQDQVRDVAERARRAGIEIYAIGVDRADPLSLRLIASEPADQHTYYVESFDVIEKLSTKFQDKFCGPDICALVAHGCEHRCVSGGGGTYTCRCDNGYELKEDGKSCRLVDPCALEGHGCEHECFGEGGVVRCRCMDGFVLDVDKKSCRIADPCTLGEHGCEHRCVSTPDSYFCKCDEGFVLNDDERTCSIADPCVRGDHRCEHHCVPKGGGAFECECNVGFALNDDRRTCRALECRVSHTDLVFVIDSSKSITPENFELVKGFVGQIVGSLDVAPERSRVGLVQFSHRVHPEFPLGRHSNAAGVLGAVAALRYVGKGTSTGQALRHLALKSFSEGEGARAPSQNVTRVAVVFTDGRAQDNITEWASKLKEMDVTVYAVGIGKAVESELREIASDPDKDHFYYSTDFSAISRIAEKLKLRICAEEVKKSLSVSDPCHCEAALEFRKHVLSLIENLQQNYDNLASKVARLDNSLHLQGK